MQLQRTAPARFSLSQLVAVPLAAAAIFLVAQLPSTDAASAMLTNSQLAEYSNYGASLPDRSFAFQTTSGTTTNTKGGGSNNSSDDDGNSFGAGGRVTGPGAEAALAAVYDVGGSYTIFRIDPITGNGTFAFSVTGTEVADSLAQAATLGVPVLIAPEAGGSPQLYASPDGECVLVTTFTDGKQAQFAFDC